MPGFVVSGGQRAAVMVMAHVAGHLAGWLYANVLGNFVASVLWTVPAFAWHHRRIKRHITAEVRRLRAKD